MSNSLPNPGEVPPEIADLVRERAEARGRHDWRVADELKARIEAVGWRVTDRGKRSNASPAAPPTAEIDGELRYGSAAAVPSRLDEAATAEWTVVVVASEEPEPFSRLMTALRAHAPAGTQVVVVVNDPSAAQADALRPDSADRGPIGGGAPEMVRTSVRLGYAAVLNIGLRRVAGELVLLADGTAVPTADALTPLSAALHDPAVAAAGGCGLVAVDPGNPRPSALHRLDDAGGPSDVTALEMGWLAFRRSDYAALGPLDEHFVTPAWLDAWWTLRLRAGAAGAEPASADDGTTADGGANADATAPAHPEPAAFPARRAVALPLPLERHAAPWPPDRTRLNRRNMYRVLDALGWVEDLA